MLVLFSITRGMEKVFFFNPNRNKINFINMKLLKGIVIMKVLLLDVGKMIRF